MKNLLRFLGLIVLIFICTCAGKKMNLRLNLKQGMIHKYRCTTEQKISQTVQNQKLDMDQIVIMEYTYEVKEVDDAGNAVVEITHDKIGFMQDGPMGKIEYKSWEEQDEKPLITRGFATLIDQNYTIKMTPQGRILEISGTDKIIDDMLKNFDLPADSVMIEQMRENLKNQYGNEAMKEVMEKTFVFYPDKPVGVGNSWSAKFNLTRGFPMTLINAWKLRSIKNGKVHIDLYTKIEPNTKTSLMQIGDMKMSYVLSGEQKGYIIVDTLTGWMIESTTEQSFEGKVNIAGMFGEEQKMEWPISITGTVTIETLGN